MRYRGAVNYYVNLPANPTPGDVWVVRYQGTAGTVPNGHAYCWEEAPVSSEKTYIGDIPAYSDIINHNPDIVNWLKSKEQRDLAWAAFTFGYGIFFMTPNSSAYLNTESQLNKRGNFLYPLVFNISSGLCFRESQLAEQYQQYNSGVFAFDYRDYNSIHKILDESSNHITREYMSRTYSADASYKVVLNGVTYNPYYFSFYNTSHPLNTRPDNGQPSYATWVNGGSSSACFDVDIMVHGAIDQIQPANFVSNRLLLDVNGNIVQPGSSTYTYAYAGIEEELQWVDLGNLAETLPTDKGCIYYNGICYSAGGFSMDKYMLRKEPAGEGSFYMNLFPDEVGHGTIVESKYSNNIIGRYIDPDASFASVTITVGETGSAQPQFAGNIIWLSSVLRPSAFVNTGGAWANLIVGEGLVVTGHNEGCSYNAIFGTNHTLVGGNVFDYNTVGGYGNSITISGTNWVEYNTIFGESNSIEGSAAYANVLMGYGNHAFTGSIDTEAILLGKNNIAYTRGNATNVLIGDGNVLVDGSYNYNNLLGHQNIAKGSELFLFGESNTATGSDSNNNCYRSYAIGIQNHLIDASYTGAFGELITANNSYESYCLGYYNNISSSGYSVLLGVSGNSIDCYEIANVGYDNRILASGYGYGIGTSNTMAGAYECGISGYYNTIETTIENPQGYSGHNYGVYYSHVLGTYNKAKDTSGAWLFGYSNQSTGDQYMALIGYNNISESYATGTSYGRTNYRTNNCGALIGYYNQVHASENGSCNYPYIFGAYNHINSNLQYVYHTYIIGEGNNSTDSIKDTYIVGDFNTTNETENVYLLGSHITITNTNNAIRLGFVPLINDDFFAIGDGTRVYNESTYDWDETPHSIIRIDSSKNIYLNSTVPTPPIPTTNGTYALNVLNGASSWVSGGGGGSSVIANPSGAATDSLTKISIDNVIYSLSGSGTYVEANPSGTGSIDLTSVEIGSTIYNIPQGVNVVANPSGTASTDLSSLEVGSTIYSIPQGTNVTANPSGTATTDLTKVEIGSTIYSIPEGTVVEANPVASATDTLTKLEVGSTVYEVPQGTEVEANPSGSATDTLNTIQIGNTVYEISGGGGTVSAGTIGTQFDVTIGTNQSITKTFEELGITEKGYYLVGMASSHAETSVGWKWFGYLSYSGRYTGTYQSSYIKALDYYDTTVTMQEQAQTLTFTNNSSAWSMDYRIQVMPLHPKVMVDSSLTRNSGIITYSMGELVGSWGTGYGFPTNVGGVHCCQFTSTVPALTIVGNVCFMRLCWQLTGSSTSGQSKIFDFNQGISDLLCSSTDLFANRSSKNGSFLYAHKYTPDNSDQWTTYHSDSPRHRVWIEKVDGKLRLREEAGASGQYSFYDLTMTFTIPVTSTGFAQEYTDEERLVGKWFGQPMYQKTIKYISRNNESDTDIVIDNTILHGTNCYVVGIETVYGYGYLMESSDPAQNWKNYTCNAWTSPEPMQAAMHLPYYGGGTTNHPMVYLYSDGVHFMKNGGYSDAKSVVVTLKYVKISTS